MIGRELEYLFPQAIFILLLGVLLLALFQFKNYFFRKKTFENLGDSQILSKVLLPRSPFMSLVKGVVILLAWGFAASALMQPRGNAHYPLPPHKTEKVSNQEMILLIDASASMEVDDTRLGVSRLAYAKEIAKEIADQISGIPGALYAFTSELTPLAPSTQDKLFLRLSIDQIKINQGEASGTDVIGSLKAIYDSLAGKEGLPVTLLLFTDGGDNRLTPNQEANQQLIDQLGLDRYPHIQLMIIGMGTREGKVIPGFSEKSSLEVSFLQSLAKKGHGIFTESNQASTEGNAKNALEFIESQKESSKLIPSTSKELIAYDYYFQWPLGLALFFLTLFLFLPETTLLFLPLLCIINPVSAYETIREREAFDAFESKQYSLATSFFRQRLIDEKDPLQRAILHYDLGTIYLAHQQYAEAAKEFSQIPYSRELPPLLAKKFAINSLLLNLQQAEQEEEPLFLKRAKRQLRRFKKLLSQEDYEKLDKALSTLSISPSKVPETPPTSQIKRILNALEDAIETQEERQTLLQNWQEIDKEVEQFIPTVLAFQLADKGCQKELWEEVIPLFFKGVEFFQTAKSSQNFSDAILSQEEALRNWYQVLALLKHPPKEKPQEVSRQHSLNQVLQYLQEMEREDVPVSGNPPVIKQGLKPW